jgi:hypothetical protein
VIDRQGLQLIARQIIRDGRSLLQYVGEAYPYAPHQAEPAVHRLMALAKDQNAAVGRLVRYLQRHHATPPLLGSFPTEFTSTNFVALMHLLPPLQKDEERGIAELERSLATLPIAEIHALLADYLQSKRRALETLNDICKLDAQAEHAGPSVIPSSTAVQPTH